MTNTIVFLLFSLLALVPARTGFAAVLTGEFLWMHDPSRILKCNGKYFVYYTGENILMRTSTDLIEWKTGKAVLASVPEWARKAVPQGDGKTVWAPDVIFVNNRYYLFWSYSSFGSRTSVTGLLTSPTLDPESPDYKWTDRGVVLASTRESDFNAIDPGPILDERGELWLSIGSFGRGGIKLVKLDRGTGKPTTDPVTIAAGRPVGPEAPYLHYRDGTYYLFLNDGFCCQGMNSTYQILIGRSKTIIGPYLDREGKDLAQGGGSPFLITAGEEIGPGHAGILSENGIDHLTYHYYGSRTNGVPTLGRRTLVWDAQGWPRPAADLAPGRYAIVSKASGLALGVHDIGFAEGTPVDQFTYLNNPFQHWNVGPTGDGYYSIGSLGTGRYIDLFECSPKNGTKIGLYPWMNNDCQRWRIEPTGDGTFRILNKGGGTALTLPGGTKEPLALMQGHAWKNDDGQQWLFKKVE
jgi:arabinan endo-1,5-alpha-L-arabinosidase